MKYNPHDYQRYATNFILEHPISAVFLDMGLGKSVITLSAIYDLLETIESEQATPSLSQAQRLKRLSQAGALNEDTMLSIMMEQKKPVKNDIVLSGEKLRKYFPKSYTPMQMENTIFKLLDAWQRKRQRDQSR